MTQVLVADDDDAIRGAVAGVLSDEGYDVTAVTNGQEALDRCHDAPPDLVLLDLMMPVMDGFEFLRRGQDGCRAPVIVMSAGFRKGQLPAGSGAVGFIEKPFDFKDLLATVQQHVGRAGADSAQPSAP